MSVIEIYRNPTVSSRATKTLEEGPTTSLRSCFTKPIDCSGFNYLIRGLWDDLNRNGMESRFVSAGVKTQRVRRSTQSIRLPKGRAAAQRTSTKPQFEICPCCLVPGTILFQAAQLCFAKYTFRETAVQTNQELRKCPDGRLLVVVSTWKMNVDLGWKTALSTRSARFARHVNTKVVEFPLVIPSISAYKSC